MGLFTIERYLEYMGIRVDDLRGKLVLDVGAGSASFARECMQEDIANVISVEPSPDYSDICYIRRLGGQAAPIIVARSEYLPFGEGTFDLVVSNIAVPMLARCREEVRATLEEMCRVTKIGCEVRIVDIVIHRRDDLESWIGEKLLELSEGDYEVSRFSWTKEIPEFPGKFAEHRLCIIKKKPVSS